MSELSLLHDDSHTHTYVGTEVKTDKSISFFRKKREQLIIISLWLNFSNGKNKNKKQNKPKTKNNNNKKTKKNPKNNKKSKTGLGVWLGGIKRRRKTNLNLEYKDGDKDDD